MTTHIPRPKTYDQQLNEQEPDSVYLGNHNDVTNNRNTPVHLKSASSESIPKLAPLKHSGITLSRRLLITVLPTVLIPLAIASTVGYRIFQKQAEGQIKRQLQDQVLLAGQSALQLRSDGLKLTEMVASNPLVIDAARVGTRKVEADRLDKKSLKELENSFAATKLLDPDQALNDYLSKVKTTGGVAELFFTEGYGLNIAYSNSTNDFVQNDEEWWQKGKTDGHWVGAFEFDQSANAISIDLVRDITDPKSGKFLGVVKAVLPSSAFEIVTDYLQHSGIKGSQQIQLLDSNNSAVIKTIAAQGASDTQEIVGGEAVADIARALVKAPQDQGITPEQAISEVKNKYSLKKLQLDYLPYETMGKGLFSSEEASFVRENGQLLIASFLYDGKQYTLASIPQTDWVAVASIDNGEVASAGRNLVWAFALIFLALGGIAIPLVLHLAKQLSAPITNLSGTAEAVAAGNLDIAAEPVGTAEIQTLAHTFNKLVTRVKGLLRQQATETEQAQLFANIATARTRTAADLEYIFYQAIQGAQQILQADRILIYRFNPDWSGYIASESVASGWPRALGNKIEDSCIGKELIEGYKQGRVVPTNNVLEAGLHPEHLQLMEQLKIKANLVTPIFKDGELFGLLIAHHCSAPHVWQESEIEFLKQLATQLGFSLDRVKFVDHQQAETERFQQLNAMISVLRESFEIEQVYTTAINSIRSTLKTDRALVYLFDENWQGSIIAESVAEDWPKALGEKITDPCFAKEYVEKYKQGRVKATDNIEQAGLTECHLSQLKPFKVRANLVAPILAHGKLYGLLVTHQCSHPRHWLEPEINFFKQVAIQVGSALDQIALLEQQKEARQTAEAISVEQRQQKEALQHQLLGLLEEVEGAARGDLTVRAEVSTGEIGTVADFFNAVIESLRAIVTQVKTSALEVNTSLEENEGALRQLSEETSKQAEETTHTLESVAQMTYSIQEVAKNAQKAAEVTRASSETALEGGKVMDRSLENILILRETISETAKKVKRLGESSQQISKAVSLIEKIALQTNLLAINAGIEAARAGEQGQGFAVVAEEVGQLAAQSTAATKEIEQIVESIQQETNQVVEAMEQSTTQVVEGTTLAGDAKQSLEEILQVSRQIDQLVQSISDATVSQTKTSQAITNLMSEMAFVSARNSDASNQVSLSLQQTVEIAQKLQESVGQFKVGAEV